MIKKDKKYSFCRDYEWTMVEGTSLDIRIISIMWYGYDLCFK